MALGREETTRPVGRQRRVSWLILRGTEAIGDRGGETQVSVPGGRPQVLRRGPSPGLEGPVPRNTYGSGAAGGEVSLDQVEFQEPALPTDCIDHGHGAADKRRVPVLVQPVQRRSR